MKSTLSIVLPVHNGEHRLADQVHELLDVLPDLARRFEILVVDDGSVDDTPHVADELSRSYPQVRFVRHSVSLGLAEAIQTGLDHTQGELVVIGDARCGLPAGDLASLWQLRHERDLVHARKPIRSGPGDAGIVDRLLRMTRSRREASSGIPEVHMVRRSALERLRVDVAPAAPARPNFLAKLKAFAVGE